MQVVPVLRLIAAVYMYLYRLNGSRYGGFGIMRFSRDQMIGRVNKPSQPINPHKSATIDAVSVMRKAAKNRRSRLSHAVLNLNTACSSISLSSSGTSLMPAYSLCGVSATDLLARAVPSPVSLPDRALFRQTAIHALNAPCSARLSRPARAARLVLRAHSGGLAHHRGRTSRIGAWRS